MEHWNKRVSRLILCLCAIDKKTLCLFYARRSNFAFCGFFGLEIRQSTEIKVSLAYFDDSLQWKIELYADFMLIFMAILCQQIQRYLAPEIRCDCGIS